jgi:predicted amidohydrolase YtcJ
MRGVLVKDCVFLDSTKGSVYCEGGQTARIYRGEGPEVPPDVDVIEANGGTLLPGLVDSHCHPFEYGWLKRSVDLRGSSNMTGVRLRLSAGVQRAKPGEWVIGMGWDQEAFPDRRIPSRDDIDEISPDNPVAMSRICGHIALINSTAIKALGFASRSGPEYERDAAGRLTGIVKEGALTEVFQSVPRTAERLASDLQGVEGEAARLGLTALHCIVSPEGYREELSALLLLHAQGTLGLRYRVYIPPESLDYVNQQGFPTKLHGEKVRINGVKIFTDGSLGARTAALREPYADDPGNTGILRMKDAELSDLIERVDAMGYQAIVHAIGDRAVEQAIDALARVAGTRNPRRHRVEHAGLLPRDLRAKMVKHGIRVAVQPSFVTSDTWAVDRLGEERTRDLYPTRSILNEGIVASGGSDCPVESLSPILGMWAAMSRGGVVPEEALSLTQAVDLYTSLARSNGFDDFGFSEGSPADLTLLDSDVSEMHPALFRKVGVLATIVGGTVTHSYGSG